MGRVTVLVVAHEGHRSDAPPVVVRKGPVAV
jgi:hypothetical protein